MKAGVIERLNIAYNLDEGGHSFEEEPPAALAHVGAVIWDDPDPDYVPWIRDGREDYYGLDCPVYAFIPNYGSGDPNPEWPVEYRECGDGAAYVLVRSGFLNESDHSCNCHGFIVAIGRGAPIAPKKVAKWLSDKLVEATPDFLEDPTQPAYWMYDGQLDDNACQHLPHPDCPRCGGEGYVTSYGGHWALYARKPEVAKPGAEETEEEE
jgi:hypothetical protein